ncbi:hypothetical protein [Candidatus Magnetobacterium casense]|uniref:Radical SAM protein n=1 Tax=Candidatus Magnetobacterium casense TaxID=1455061 RepID=A0ABS6S3Z6_9BACT|nr:hypothetical protein [Candidatus Magnetobacterium casensis]MBV6343577.1 hypothetical protein [Candidatus Magnetobacterium casensis]
MSWGKSIIYWREDDEVFVSVPFTWYLPMARRLCEVSIEAGRCVHAGGPAVDLMPEYLAGVAEYIGGSLWPSPISRHNPDATFTTRGCPNRCKFCAVPVIEGDLRELSDWIPAPIICDNNLLAASAQHFDLVIDRLKPFKGVDFNQGLDARLLNTHHIERLQELCLPKLRFAFDHVSLENKVMSAIERVLKAGFAHRRLGCYVMFGFEDSPEDALYRAETIKAKGIKPFPQRYQPLNALKKDSWIGQGWTAQEMHRFQRYWCRQNWLSKIPYAEFRDGLQRV